VIKLNIDEEPLAAHKFNVRSVPTLVLFRNGVPVETLVGAQPLEALRAAARRHLA
jgi:thioredoxin 1